MSESDVSATSSATGSGTTDTSASPTTVVTSCHDTPTPATCTEYRMGSDKCRHEPERLHNVAPRWHGRHHHRDITDHNVNTVAVDTIKIITVASSLSAPTPLPPS